MSHKRNTVAQKIHKSMLNFASHNEWRDWAQDYHPEWLVELNKMSNNRRKEFLADAQIARNRKFPEDPSVLEDQDELRYYFNFMYPDSERVLE